MRPVKYFKALILITAALFFSARGGVLTHAKEAREDSFKRASDISRYRGIKDTQTAELIVNTAEALHEENQRILKILDELREQVEGLKKSVEEAL